MAPKTDGSSLFHVFGSSGGAFPFLLPSRPLSLDRSSSINPPTPSLILLSLHLNSEPCCCRSVWALIPTPSSRCGTFHSSAPSCHPSLPDSSRCPPFPLPASPPPPPPDAGSDARPQIAAWAPPVTSTGYLGAVVLQQQNGHVGPQRLRLVLLPVHTDSSTCIHHLIICMQTELQP